jgi:serine/threonine-protein kinase
LSTAVATKPKPPKLLAGKYRMVEPIGQGAMAVVWRAELAGPGGKTRSVAVKKMKIGLVGGHDYIAMFMEEARVGAELRHPNIVQVFDLCRDQDGTYCLIMEWVPGIDLRGMLGWRRDVGAALPWDLATYVGIQALQGLTAAHERTSAAGTSALVVHRDISPSNILLAETGAVKIADFGLARALDRVRSLTGPGIIKGKLAYIAPEIAHGAPASAQSDLFAMGCVLWEALAGHPLYEGQNDLAMFQQVQAANIRPLLGQRPDLPRDLAEIVHQALEPKPERRFTSARAMSTALSMILRKSRGFEGPKTLAAAVREARAHRARPDAEPHSETLELSVTDVEKLS